jgi:hypothetical protein
MGLIRNDCAHFVTIEKDIKANPGHTAIYAKGNLVKIVDDKGDLKNLVVNELEVTSLVVDGVPYKSSKRKSKEPEATIEVTKKDHNDTKNDLEGTKQELIDAKKEIEKLKETIKFLVTKEDFSLLSVSIRKQLEATSSELNGKLDVKSLEVEKKLLESSSEVFVPRGQYESKIKELEKKFNDLLNLVMKKLG